MLCRKHSHTGRLKTFLGRACVITISSIINTVVFIVIRSLATLLSARLYWQLLLLWWPSRRLSAICVHCTNSTTFKLIHNNIISLNDSQDDMPHYHTVKCFWPMSAIHKCASLNHFLHLFPFTFHSDRPISCTWPFLSTRAYYLHTE